MFGLLFQKVYFISMGNKTLLCLFVLLLINGYAQVEQSAPAAKRYLVFINGYRGYKADKEITNNEVSTKPASYWYAIDDTISARFKTDIPLYIDAHHPLTNSMHKNKARFIKAYLLSRFCFISRKSRWVLNDNINAAGFMERFEHGSIAGRNFIEEHCRVGIKDTIDIVSHSMGYAYSLGFIEEVKDRCIFGKMLAFAPESANFMGSDWSIFQEVWQYGSNMDQPHSDIICLQDGIAPQTQINGLDKMMPNKGGRVFLPEIAKRGFVKSHHLYFYTWFYSIKPNEFGYFKP